MSFQCNKWCAEMFYWCKSKIFLLLSIDSSLVIWISQWNGGERINMNKWLHTSCNWFFCFLQIQKCSTRIMHIKAIQKSAVAFLFQLIQTFVYYEIKYTVKQGHASLFKTNLDKLCFVFWDLWLWVKIAGIQ